jgi:hypothetical protein
MICLISASSSVSGPCRTPAAASEHRSACLNSQVRAGDPERIGDHLHGALSHTDEGPRNSFFDRARSSASRRISFSKVFLPSSRCSSRTWLYKARYSEAGITSSPAPTVDSAPLA